MASVISAASHSAWIVCSGLWDTTASDVLEDLDETLNAQGISLIFAELKDLVRRKIERYGLTRTINPRHFFPTIESAITAFRDETGAQWTADGQVSQPKLPGAPLHERGVPPGNGPA